MRTFRHWLTLVAAVALVLPALAAAQQFENVPQAQPTVPAAPAVPGIKIGIINVQLAMARTQEGRKASEDLQARFTPRQAELEKEREALRDLENQLRTQERTLSDDARFQLGRQIETKRKIITRMEQDLREEAEQAQEELVERIANKMQQVVDRYARENGLSLILNVFQGGPVIFAVPSVDITDPVTRLYDQTYPLAAAPPPAQQPAPRPQQPRPQTQPKPNNQ